MGIMCSSNSSCSKLPVLTVVNWRYSPCKYTMQSVNRSSLRCFCYRKGSPPRRYLTWNRRSDVNERSHCRLKGKHCRLAKRCCCQTRIFCSTSTSQEVETSKDSGPAFFKASECSVSKSCTFIKRKEAIEAWLGCLNRQLALHSEVWLADISSIFKVIR